MGRTLGKRGAGGPRWRWALSLRRERSLRNSRAERGLSLSRTSEGISGCVGAGGDSRKARRAAAFEVSAGKLQDPSAHSEMVRYALCT